MAQQGAATLVGPSGHLYFKVVGPLDCSGAARLKPRLLKALSEGYRHLVLDVEYVPYMDSEGVKMLIELLSQPHGEVQIELQGVNRSVGRVFELIHLEEYFPISVRR